MPAPDYDAAIDYAIRRLDAELPPRLTYHNVWHTEQDVLPSARRLALACGVTGHRRRLVTVAAAYHDIGFVCRYESHEQAGAELAAAVLPQFGFTAADISCIRSMILATRLVTRPANLLQAVLADADLDVLGRDDFLMRNDCLWREVRVFAPPASRLAWLQEQLSFLRRRRYCTAAAQALRETGRRRNVRRLEALIREERALHD